MTISNVSNLAQTQLLISQLSGQTGNLDTLSNQLASGDQYSDLTGYTPTDALDLLNLQSSATQYQAYGNVVQTIQNRLSIYDTTMTDMESITSLANTLVNGSQNYNPQTAASIAATASSYLKSVQLDLNQQVNGRYIYAGTRYTTAPVGNLSTSTTLATSTIFTDNSTLPTYDTAYTTVGSTSAAAYATDSATIDNGYSLTYGVSSDNPAFQQLIAGLGYLQAAGNSTDSATYSANMAQAGTLLNSAITSLEAVHTSVANNIDILTTEQKQQSTQLTDISNQIDDIQSVNPTQVSAEITALQTTLEASYTVTGDLEKLSLVNFL